MTQPSPNDSFERILAVLDRLLDPDHGCPWDREQTPASLVGYLIEEAYELQEAIAEASPAGTQEELGDCVFLLCFLGRVRQARGGFDLGQALGQAADKMIRRHPHVFSESGELSTAEQVLDQWHVLKQGEKGPGRYLSGVPRHLPALLRAHRLTTRAGQVGFDWPGAEDVLRTFEEEEAELRQAMSDGDPGRVSQELGDLLFTLANLARHLKINAEEALQQANRRFLRRFQYVEEHLAAQGRSLEEATLEEMDRLWAAAKAGGL
jgi:MazG family protein